jgi:copper chaperone NosL
MKNLKTTKLLFGIAAALLGALFLFPMWQITLIAPQYPDGISMFIWINQITGDTPSTLQNINILNHYIGMKYIEPESIPELKFFPYVVIGLIITGIASAFTGKKWVFASWSLLLLVACGLGIYDFYLWEYDYGHNLSDTAPIKIEGMVYQPPLFGEEYLLNFLAKSYPTTGGFFVIASIILSSLITFLMFVKSMRKKTVKTGSRFLAAASMASVLLFTGCEVAPDNIDYGKDHCAYCQMTIVGKQHGAEVVTAKGKAYKFDAVECMVHYLGENSETPYAFILSNTFDAPGVLSPAESSTFLISEALPSPMGENLTAFGDPDVANEIMQEKGGIIYDWNALCKHMGSKAVSALEQ